MMERIKLPFLAIAVTAILALSGCAAPSTAAEIVASASSGEAQNITASNQIAPNNDKNDPGKGAKDGKGNNGNKSNNGKGDDKGKNGKAKNNNGRAGNAPAASQGNAGPAVGQSPVDRGLGGWWRDFRGRVFGGTPEAKQGGWQLGRFKDAFPFAYPPGWAVRERGDAALVTGSWQGGEYVFQMTRTVQVQAESLQDWVSDDLRQFDATKASVRYAESGRVQIAVVSGVEDPNYDCPVAYVYLWTANPAGNNQRQARGVVSQAPGSACNPAALSAFVDAYLDRVGGDEERSPVTTPTARPSASATVVLTVVPTGTRAPATSTPSAGGSWQRTRFFNAFSFAYPQGWSMDRLGDTAHLQGEHRGRAYVVDMVWVRDAPETGLEQWARADLEDLGVNSEGLRIDYIAQGDDAQVAVVSGVRMQGYQCPVVRMYVVADNAATAGQRAYTVTVAQANGQACNLQALEDLAFSMVQQAQ